MKKTLIILIVMFTTNIEFVFADWPHVVRCPMIYSVAEPIGSSTMRNGFPHYSRSDYGLFVATGKSEKQYPAKKFIGADVKNYNTFRQSMRKLPNGFPHYSRSDYGLFVDTGKSEKQYPAIKFIGADVKNYNTFSCNHEATDGTHVTTKFTNSKCQPMAGFDISGKCNNPDPGQCLVMCAY